MRAPEPLGDGALGGVQAGKEDAALSPTTSWTTSPVSNTSRSAERIRGASTPRSSTATPRAQPRQGAVARIGGSLGERDPARSRCGASLVRPSFIAMASAVLKPMPRCPWQDGRILGHDRDGLMAVGLKDPHCPGRPHTVGVQEQHDLAHAFCSAHPATMRAARLGPMPSTS